MKTLHEFARINKIEGNVFISFDLTEIEACDCIACDVLRLECPEFIMPVLFDRSTSVTTMRYAIPECYSDVERFQGELKIEEVLTLYENILGILEECEDWYLKPQGLCFDTKYVYMNEAHSSFKFIYVPEEKQEIDTQSIKHLMISLLEKCNESSGGNIQLQLYKYFYRPKFSLTQFKSMLESYWMLLSKKEKSASNDSLEQLKEQISENSSKQDTSHSFYTLKGNRSQLSQEEIEEMVKSVYGEGPQKNKTENTNTDINTNDSHYLQQQLIGKRVEEVDILAERESFYEAKSSDVDKINANSKKKNLFNSMFNQAKYQKSSMNMLGVQERSVILKSISVHARYDLPKHIEIQFVDDIFVIGRATRTGESKGANYEFGAEITPISHLHAQIERKEGSYYLQDLGSSNGTFLNGNKIEPNKPYLIEDGDKIAFAIAYSKNSIEYAFVE